MNISTRPATTKEDLYAALEVRRSVFIEEQRIEENIERDDMDSCATHVIAESSGQVLGTGRIVNEEVGSIITARLGRMAVLKPFRRKGIATLILRALEAEAMRQGFKRVVLHSQLHVQELYEKSGYAVEGSLFYEAGIEHVTMVKNLTQK